MPAPLAGKVALITGAVRRNGRATAHALAKDGAAIVINTRSSADEARKLQTELEAIGGQALVCLADITNEDAVAQMFREIDKRFGRVDILVNNAADRARTPFTEMTFTQWRHFTSIILDGAFLCTRAAIPYMLKNGWGRIINMGGISHHRPFYHGRAHVSTAKAGLEGLTRALANEYASKNITVNCVAPGSIGGERAKTAGEVSHSEIPVGREGVFADIARMVHFLCQPESSFITGQTIHVNGGAFLT
jgi:3-oxoacyl-[acyl-carrier protein] reductase